MWALLLLAAMATGAEQMITAPGCGQTPLRSLASERIVGGSEAVPYSWPFICSLEDNGRHICGGSLVQNLNGVYYFITAAHCVSRAARFYTISCSVHDIFGNDPEKKQFNFSSAINHENYNSNTFANDISVMVLSTQPSTTSYLQPVCIADGNYYGGENCIVIGWGTQSEGGDVSRYLMEVDKPILSDSQCNSAYGSLFQTSSMLCSGLLGVGGKDACQGDSGGPLVVYRDGAWQLAGVVSWGYGCARPQYPGVYADVYRLKDWISSKIN